MIMSRAEVPGCCLAVVLCLEAVIPQSCDDDAVAAAAGPLGCFSWSWIRLSGWSQARCPVKDREWIAVRGRGGKSPIMIGGEQ